MAKQKPAKPKVLKDITNINKGTSISNLNLILDQFNTKLNRIDPIAKTPRLNRNTTNFQLEAHPNETNGQGTLIRINSIESLRNLPQISKFNNQKGQSTRSRQISTSIKSALAQSAPKASLGQQSGSLTCSRHKCVQGAERRDGTFVTFTQKPDGSFFNNCDQCRELLGLWTAQGTMQGTMQR